MAENLAWSASNAISGAAGQASVDTYADVALTSQPGGGVIFEAPFGGPIRVTCQNTGANSITFQILSALDRTLADSLWNIAVAGAPVAAAAIVYAAVINPVPDQFYKIQIKATVGAAQGIAVVRICQKRG